MAGKSFKVSFNLDERDVAYFKGLYNNVQFDYFVYDSQKLGQVGRLGWAVMSHRGDENALIIAEQYAQHSLLSRRRCVAPW